jgi:hypothetical protein
MPDTWGLDRTAEGLFVHGEIDLAIADPFEEQVCAAVMDAPGSTVLLDLSGVTFMVSARASAACNVWNADVSTFWARAAWRRKYAAWRSAACAARCLAAAVEREITSSWIRGSSVRWGDVPRCTACRYKYLLRDFSIKVLPPSGARAAPRHNGHGIHGWKQMSVEEVRCFTVRRGSNRLRYQSLVGHEWDDQFEADTVYLAGVPQSERYSDQARDRVGRQSLAAWILLLDLGPSKARRDVVVH